MKKVIIFMLCFSMLSCSNALLSAAEDISILGDINSDGKVDITDLSELSLAIIGDKTLTESQIKAADIDKNGKADLPDLARLRQYLSKVIDSLETEKNDSVPSERPTQPMASVYSVTFEDYDELSEKFKSTLEDLITKMKEENNDTEAIEDYIKNMEIKHAVSVPVSDRKILQLRNKEGFSNITFYTRELYSKPCIFYHFADGETNSYIKILDVSEELKNNSVLNVSDFMKMMDPNPDDDKFYPAYDSVSTENVIINGKSVEVVSGSYENDPRVYAAFIYDDSLVFVCCSEEKIDSGFLESLSIEDLPLKSSEQISDSEPVYD